MSDISELRQGFTMLQNNLRAAKNLVQAVRNYDVAYRECINCDKAVDLAAAHLTQTQRDTLIALGTFVAQHRATLEAALTDLPAD